MTRVALWRLAAIVPIMLVVSFASFVLLSLNPADPADRLLGPTATPAQVAKVRAELGLDDPLLERYADWLVDVLHGDLGQSSYSGVPVADAIAERFEVTLSLVFVALLFALAVGVPAGIVAALHEGRRADRVTTTISAAGQAVPALWLGTLLLALFAVRWHVFRAVFYVSPSESVLEWLRSVTLPALALGITVAATFARHTRSAMQDVLRQDYIRAAVAKGGSRRQVIVHHALRNAATPLVSVLAFQITALIGAAFVVERVFAMPGLGSLAIESIERNDPAPLLGFLLVVVLAVVIVNLLLDLAYAWIDPKVRTP